MSITENQKKTVDEILVDLEARLIAQEHRTPHLLVNFFTRAQFDTTDPRRTACWRAIVYRCMTMFLPTSPMGALGWGTIVGILISYYTLNILKEQKAIERTSALFQQTQQIQLVLIERPQLRKALYSSDNILDQDEKIQLDVVVEMLADLLDHAAASNQAPATDAAWGEYCRDTYTKCMHFRTFVDSHRSWYPNIWRWIEKSRV